MPEDLPGDVLDLIDELGNAEDALHSDGFLAPVLPGGKVVVRIAGLVYELDAPEAEPGFYRLRATGVGTAEVIGRAGLRQVREYLSLFAPAKLLLVARRGASWLAAPSAPGRLRVQGLVPVMLVREGRVFQSVIARYDGVTFWAEGSDPRGDPAVARYLREALQQMENPEALRRPRLSRFHRDGYRHAWELIKEALRDRTEERLRDALAHGGASLESYVERDEAYAVTYTVDGATHVSTVGKGDLTVLSAGICLSGQDQKFDLQSLVGVMREARDSGEEPYWQIRGRS